ncbi:MAG: hypothetical protein RBR74_02695 [Ignavibacteriaceae bacterium]|jgi:hypothetical protein|nr:hypothetical protein [Ignavibacteriaceae bacterium]
MKRVFYLIIPLFVFTQINLLSQSDKKSFEDKDPLSKVLRIQDRAGGVHNASNIGLFFENRGKLYPRRITQGPSGEFPINSSKNYIYRINQYVGVPGNVIQGRFTTNEEWEAAYGYHNSDTARIAFTDDPNSWHPQLGWPVKDENGNDIILSDQDSYCVYNDSGNTVKILGLQMAQTGYAYGSNFAKNMLFFKYEITNTSKNSYEGLYFGLHNDIDVGNISGGDPEYGDDKVDFIKEMNLIYFYDDGLSNEWPDGKTGFFGIMFLQTPKVNGTELGLTDFHYMLFNDDEIADKDTIQYGFMSSSRSLYNSSVGGKYFHVSDPNNIHFDDPSLIPASGMDILAHMSSGPYTINPGDTLVFYTAIVAGETYDELIQSANTAKFAMDNQFDLAKPPTRPSLYSTDGDVKVTLYWNDSAERTYDKFSGYDFEGYRLYKSTNKGVTWNRIAAFDLKNSIGANTGLQYSFVDTNVINGFEYWYSITAYDQGSSLFESLESAIGNTLAAVNTVSAIPRSEAIGRTPVTPIEVTNLNTGNTNFILNASSVDDESLAGNEYKTTFEFVPRIEFGDLKTNVTITVTDTAAVKPYKFAIEFTSETSFDLKNITLDEIIRENFPYQYGGRNLTITGFGLRVTMVDSVDTPTEFRPQAGDVIAINFSMNTVKNNNQVVIEKRSYQVDQVITSTDGVSLQVTSPQIIQSVSRIGGNDNIEMTFEVVDESLVKNAVYIASVEGSGNLNNNGFVLLSVSGTSILLDTLFSGDNFTFDGIEGTIIFPSNSAPSTGNKFSVETVKPVILSIKDSYAFKIADSKVDYQQVKNEISKIKVVPNPYVVSSLWEPEFGELRKEPLRQIQFINLPPECTIYIFTVDADLIKTIYHNSDAGTEVWDLRTEGGRELAAGMYIYVVKTKDSEFKERFAIIK